MKKNNKKTKKPAASAPQSPKTPVIANCTRTSNFVAHRCGESEKRLTTHHRISYSYRTSHYPRHPHTRAPSCHWHERTPK